MTKITSEQRESIVREAVAKRDALLAPVSPIQPAVGGMREALSELLALVETGVLPTRGEPHYSEWSAKIDAAQERARALLASTSPAQTGEPTHAQLAAGALIPQVSGFATRQTGGVDQAWMRGALQELANRIKHEGLEIFDSSETPQMVRDAIEWFAAELNVSDLPATLPGIR